MLIQLVLIRQPHLFVALLVIQRFALSDFKMSLTIEADRFLRDDGSQFDWCGFTSFMLFYKSLDGFVMEPYLDDCTIVSEQVVMTLMMAHYIEHRDPNSYGERFFGHIRPFANALKSRGMYWMPIVFADAQVIMPDKNQQLQFFNQIAAEFRGIDN